MLKVCLKGHQPQRQEGVFENSLLFIGLTSLCDLLLPEHPNHIFITHLFEVPVKLTHR
jgi:hypothetical protein